MKALLSRMDWKLVLTASVLIYIVTLILGLGVSLVLPAFFDWSRLAAQSAFQAGSLITAVLVIGVTAYGAWWVARKVEHAALLQGFLVGLVVALLSFLLDVGFSRRVSLVGLALYALMVAAGWLGGLLGSRR